VPLIFTKPIAEPYFVYLRAYVVVMSGTPIASKDTEGLTGDHLIAAAMGVTDARASLQRGDFDGPISSAAFAEAIERRA
jgi:hypothetical protein